jgi:uncharacterized protein (TIGR03089 family)
VSTPFDLLSRQLASDGTRPLFTFYDDATGERVELSIATTANWVAKTAGFLTDEYDVDLGDVVAVDLPLHWQTPVLLLATWAAGGVVAFGRDQAVVVTISTAPDADVPLTLEPMGADFARLVAAHPDSWQPINPSGADVVEAAADDLPHGARVLSVLSYDVGAALSYALIAPLAGDGSVVLVRNADVAGLAARAATERVTHTLGVDVSGLPRLDA